MIDKSPPVDSSMLTGLASSAAIVSKFDCMPVMMLSLASGNAMHLNHPMCGS